MDILTDDLISKAIDAVLAKRGEVLNGAVSSEYEVAGIYARAALEAILPDVVEMAAKIPEEHARLIRAQNEQWKKEGWWPDATSIHVADLLDKKATAIRSLLNKEGE